MDHSLQNKLASVGGKANGYIHELWLSFHLGFSKPVHIRNFFCPDFGWFIHARAFAKACLNFTVPASSLVSFEHNPAA